VSYNRKHNEANGELNRDGSDDNRSWNCGAEGATDDEGVLALRSRQARNLMALLLLSQGVPMILAGDEVRRTQGGNNNAYCQDNETSWLDWGLVERNADFLRFTSRLIRFRKAHPQLRRRLFFEDDPRGQAAVWLSPKGGPPDVGPESRTLGLHLLGEPGTPDLLLVAHAHWEKVVFSLPKLRPGRGWHVFLDTSLPPPLEVMEPGEEPRVGRGAEYTVGPRSVVVLVGR
jgi:glycogen operon protein